MGYTDKDFNNPEEMFIKRTRALRVRIQNLESSLVTAQHPFTRAVIKQELDRCADEYVGRSIQGRNS